MIAPTPPPTGSQPLPIEPLLNLLREAYGEPQQGDRLPPIDELVMTILSQNTSDTNTSRAFASLQDTFPNWDAVVAATDGEVADAIRSGGLADTKAPRIRQALIDIRERLSGYDLTFLTDMTIDDARAWLTSLDGVGPKTASCVLLFSLDMPAMPVDTHVHRVALRLGLVPPRTSAERAHSLLEAIIPDDETYAAHMLMIQHGRRTCTARRPRCEGCVLVQYCPSAGTYLNHQTGVP